MRSLKLEAVGRLALAESPIRPPNPGETVLKVSHCSVCRTDAKAWQKGHRDLTLPRVLGHEIAGAIETTGCRFVVWPGEACGICPDCTTGHENRCSRMSIIGFHRDGGFAEYVTVPDSALIPVPPSLPSHLACLAEPLACTLNALESVGISSGKSVLIFGAGTVGLMAALAAQALGAAAFALERDSTKYAKSKEFRKVVGVRTFTGSERLGMDIALNAAPSLDTFIRGLKYLKPGGCFCHFSAFVDDSPVPLACINDIHYRELHVTGAYGCTRKQMNDAIRLLDEYREPVALLVEEIIDLERVPDVMTFVLSGQALKFIVDFHT